MGTLSQPDVIGATASLDGVQWNILGQIIPPQAAHRALVRVARDDAG